MQRRAQRMQYGEAVKAAFPEGSLRAKAHPRVRSRVSDHPGDRRCRFVARGCMSRFSLPAVSAHIKKPNGQPIPPVQRTGLRPAAERQYRWTHLRGAAVETFRVDILTKDFGLLGPEATGLTAPIQAARVVVTHGHDSRSHVVVRSADAAADLPADDVVAKLFPADFVSCVRSDVDGETTLSCSPS